MNRIGIGDDTNGGDGQKRVSQDGTMSGTANGGSTVTSSSLVTTPEVDLVEAQKVIIRKLLLESAQMTVTETDAIRRAVHLARIQQYTEMLNVGTPRSQQQNATQQQHQTNRRRKTPRVRKPCNIGSLDWCVDRASCVAKMQELKSAGNDTKNVPFLSVPSRNAELEEIDKKHTT